MTTATLAWKSGSLRRPGSQSDAHAAAMKFHCVIPRQWILDDVTHKFHADEVRNAENWRALGKTWKALHNAEVEAGQHELGRLLKQHELLKRLATDANQFVGAYVLGMHAPTLNYWGVVICLGCLTQGVETAYPCLTVDQVRDGL